MSRSRTAQMGIVMLLPFSLMVRTVRLPGLMRVWAFYLLALGTLTFTIVNFEYFDDVMVALGKDPSLTGRVPLWSMLFADIARRPLLGYGYGAFFVADNSELDYINKTLGWIVPEAHQGYIDMTIQLGWTGLLLLIWIVAGTILRALSAMRERSAPWASVAAVYALGLVMTNMTEATMMHHGTLDSVLLPYFAAALSQERARQKAAAQSHPDRGEALQGGTV
jgi:O-antigen ligase